MKSNSLRVFWAISLWVLGALASSVHALPQDPAELQVGHWVEVKGTLGKDGNFKASSLTLADPEESEALVGEVSELHLGEGWCLVLDQRITLSDRTKYRKISPAKLRGKRIKVEGHYRGFDKFSARKVSPRGDGRERIIGRVDSIRREGEHLVLDIMRFRVEVSDATEYERERELASYALAPDLQEAGNTEDWSNDGLIIRVDDDYLPGSFQLAENLQVGLRAEYKRDTKRDFNLDGALAADRIDDNLSLRAVAIWSPSERFFMRFAGRFTKLFRYDEFLGRSETSTPRVSEAYAYWSRVMDTALDIQLGRQDYFDEREWLWDENLDALRFLYHPGHWIYEFTAATALGSNSQKEEATDRYILQATRRWPDRMASAYLIDQRTDLGGRDFPLFGGLRANGEWFPNQTSWAELAVVRGYEGASDIRGFGFDLGTTWSPPDHRPWYFTAGYAFGSGDGNSLDNVDHSFRQTGIQDNNSKLGGLTSFKYYGELLEPELSNLHILTAGVGRRIGRKMSVDLIYHKYDQDESFNRLRNTNLKIRPNGLDTSLGQELDLVFGHRSSLGIDTEIVLAAFDPGGAFDGAHRAYFVKFQFRYRVR